MKLFVLTALFFAVVFSACSSRNDGFNYGHRAIQYCEKHKCN